MKCLGTCEYWTIDTCRFVCSYALTNTFVNVIHLYTIMASFIPDHRPHSSIIPVVHGLREAEVGGSLDVARRRTSNRGVIWIRRVGICPYSITSSKDHLLLTTSLINGTLKCKPSLLRCTFLPHYPQSTLCVFPEPFSALTKRIRRLCLTIQHKSTFLLYYPYEHMIMNVVFRFYVAHFACTQ